MPGSSLGLHHITLSKKFCLPALLLDYSSVPVRGRYLNFSQIGNYVHAQ